MKNGNVIYESYDGMLDVEHQQSYTVTEEDKYFLIEEHNVWKSKSFVVRVAKSMVNMDFDWSDYEAVGHLEENVRNGVIDGQWNYKGKWYSKETINKIQMNNKDMDWIKYVR